MKITIDAGIAKEIMKRFGRDYYSYAGMDALIDFYDEIDENIEFDPISICCDCSEYGDDCTLSFSDLISDYDRYAVESLGDPEEWEQMDEKEKVNAIVKQLEDATTVIRVYNGNYIVFNF